MKQFSFEEEKNGQIYALPVKRLQEECAHNLVLKGALEETVDACRAYAHALSEAVGVDSCADALNSDQLEKEINLLYRDHPEFENTIAEKISNLVRLLNMKNIDEVSLLRALKTNRDYARCALRTIQQLQEEIESSQAA